MVMTPDLAPGARFKMWVLLFFTFISGLITYITFGRTIILWVTFIVFIVLLYLLIGVKLTLKYDRSLLKKHIEQALLTLENSHWILLDTGGTVLHLSVLGEKFLLHSKKILIGQSLYDLIPINPPILRVRFRELLRFASAGKDYSIELKILTDQGHLRIFQMRTLLLKKDTYKHGVIALNGEFIEEIPRNKLLEQGYSNKTTY